MAWSATLALRTGRNLIRIPTSTTRRSVPPLHNRVLTLAYPSVSAMSHDQGAAPCEGKLTKQGFYQHVHGSINVYMVPWGSNTPVGTTYIFLLHVQNKNKVAVIDPGSSSDVVDAMDKLGFDSLHGILNTHHHWDHTDGNEHLKGKYDKCVVYGFEGDRRRIPGIDVDLKEGMSSELEDFFGEPVEVIETPGHTVGHIAFYFPNCKVAFVGDTVFAMGCGRLFEGTPQQMHNSMQKLVAKLPRDTTLYCAHEYTLSNAKFAVTVDPKNQALLARFKKVEALREQNMKTVPFTMEEELNTNPFLRCQDQDLRDCIGMSGVSDDSKVFAKVRALKDNF